MADYDRDARIVHHDDTRAVETDRQGGVFAGAWVNIILGLIVIAVPFFTVETASAFWSNVITGLLIVALAGYNAWAASNVGAAPAAWVSGANVLLGIWLIVVPFVFAASTIFVWSNIILGAIIALVAAFNAWAAANVRSPYVGRPGV